MLISCVDEISLNVDSENSFYVVDAQITDELRIHTIKLNSSAIIGEGNDNIFKPVTSAEIKVIDREDNSIQFFESADSPGVYEAMMSASVNMEYRLEAKLSDGIIIRSDPIITQATPQIDSISFDVKIIKELNAAGNTVENQYIDVFANTTITNATGPFLKWRIEGEYEFLELPTFTGTRTCYIKPLLDINSIVTLDTRETENEITGQFINRIPIDSKFDLLYCFHLYQYSISEEEYEFLSQSIQLLELEGSLFDLPPGKLQTNLFVENKPEIEVYGFFSIVQEEYQRLFVTEDDLGLIIYSPCYSGFNREAGCFDCTTRFRSTLEKPEYWPR